jgi:5-methylcytosine-specific restriction endonuclease McrA
MEHGKICIKCNEWKVFEEFGKDAGKKDGLKVWCKECRKKYDRQRKRTTFDIITDTGKICTKCNEWKEYKEFYKCSYKKDGFRCECKECYKKYEKENGLRFVERKKRYRQENIEKLREKNREFMKQYYIDNTEKIKKYHQDNAEEIKKQRKKWYQENAEELKKQSKKRYQENSEFAKEYSKQRYRENAEKLRLVSREYRQKNSKLIKQYNKQYRQTEKGKAINNDAHARRSKRAKAVGGEFLYETKQEIFKRDKGICQHCGIEVSMKRGGNASFDHLIPVSWGGKSTLENGQLLCKSCNSSKSNKLDEILLATLPNPDDNIVWEVMNKRFAEIFKKIEYWKLPWNRNI